MHEQYLSLLRDFQELASSMDPPYLFVAPDEKLALTPSENHPTAEKEFVYPQKTSYKPPEKPAPKEEVVEIITPKPPQKKPKEAPLNPVFEEFSPLIERFLPQMKVVKSPPSDHDAQKLSHSWESASLQAEVIIFTSAKSAPEETFLTHLTEAINVRLCSAKKLDVKIIEQSSDWKTLSESGKIKLVIAAPSVFHSEPFLRLVKKNAASNTYFLGSIPLITLEPFAAYAENPLKKKQLWNRLCQLLKPSMPVS